MQTFRVILYQKPPGTPVSRTDLDEMISFGPHFICFPEYFFVNRRLGNHHQTPHNQERQQQRIEAISRECTTVVIGGSMPEYEEGKLYNTCFVFDRGTCLGSYRKRHLYFREEGKITPGDSYCVFSAYGITFGVLICADVFFDESFDFMHEQGARIIFSPTFSPKKVETVEEKYARDRDIYVRGAERSGAVIIKVCAVPSPYKDFIQARSLIANGTDILYRVAPSEEETSLIIKKEITL